MKPAHSVPHFQKESDGLKDAWRYFSDPDSGITVTFPSDFTLESDKNEWFIHASTDQIQFYVIAEITNSILKKKTFEELAWKHMKTLANIYGQALPVPKNIFVNDHSFLEWDLCWLGRYQLVWFSYQYDRLYQFSMIAEEKISRRIADQFFNSIRLTL